MRNVLLAVEPGRLLELLQSSQQEASSAMATADKDYNGQLSRWKQHFVIIASPLM